MATSRATTVAQYLEELPPERREVIERVRDFVNAHMPAGYRETIAFGMIGWGIPLERYPDTYNRQPLGYVALAAQKNYNSLYLMGAYADPRQRARLERAYAQAGSKLPMGRSCLNFRTVDELPLDVIGELIESTSVDAYIAHYESVRGAPKEKPAKKSAAKKPAAKKKSAAKKTR